MRKKNFDPAEFFEDRGGDDSNVTANQEICRAGSFQA